MRSGVIKGSLESTSLAATATCMTSTSINLIYECPCSAMAFASSIAVPSDQFDVSQQIRDVRYYYNTHKFY